MLFIWSSDFAAEILVKFQNDTFIITYKLAATRSVGETSYRLANEGTDVAWYCHVSHD